MMLMPPARNRTVPPENCAKSTRFRIVRAIPAKTRTKPVGKKILFGLVNVIMRKINMIKLKPSLKGRYLLTVSGGRWRTWMGTNATLYPAEIKLNVLVDGKE